VSSTDAPGLRRGADFPARVHRPGGIPRITDPEACASGISRQELPKQGVKDDVLQREQLQVGFQAVHSVRTRSFQRIRRVCC
jgi:hypothetical protein